MWNLYRIPWNPYEICGIYVKYVESMWNTMESIWNMWNPYGILWNPCGICGIHMDSMEGIVVDSIPFHLDSRGIFHGIFKFHEIFKFHGVSIWNEHGNLHQNGWALSQTNSIWNPWNPHGIGMDSTWNPPGMWGHSKDLPRPLALSVGFRHILWASGMLVLNVDGGWRKS